MARKLTNKPTLDILMKSTPLTCVVDDAADYRFLLQQLFERFMPDYPVRFFADGQALLDEFDHVELRPGLVILDRHMPRLDGHQTLLLLRAHPNCGTIPIVMMSADASLQEIEGCYKAGANSFLIKKQNVQDLKRVLNAICQYWLVINQSVGCSEGVGWD